MIEEYRNTPEICGICERFFEGYCIPIKEKYGYESVTIDQKPSINCPYENSHCSCGAPIINGNCYDENCKL